MINQLLVTLINSVLGTGKKTARGNMAYHCPYCNHHKPKLEINFTENKEGVNPWHCWVCDKKGKSIIPLLYQFKASPEKIAEAKSLVKDISPGYIKEVKSNFLKLPKEYINLATNNNSILRKHAINYLKQRNITLKDIIKYDIGYCEDGLYANMIIIPTYDNDGKLNYFVARTFKNDEYIKYKNPQASRDIIPNEHFINWDIPIILCEGIFDAIAIRRNAIPLFGKTIPKSLMKKIYEKQVKQIYILLDSDAIMDSIKMTDSLMKNGIDVYYVNLSEEDPSDMGFKKVINLIKETKQTSFSDLMRMKLNGKTKKYMEI